MADSRQLQFYYDCESSIDANTLLLSQLNFINVINELQKEIYPEAQLKIKLSPFEKGSFIVNLIFETTWIENLFTNENAAVIPVILSSLESILNIREKLGLAKAKEEIEDNSEIEIITEGDVTIKTGKKIFNIHRSNRVLDEAINKSFEPLIKDESIKSITVRDNKSGEKFLDIERNSFSKLVGKNQYFESSRNEQVYYDQVLYIKKPNLYPEENKPCTWGLIHRNRDIPAKMLDLDFLKAIDKGLRIAKGDRLIADLRVYLKYDPQLGTELETNRFDVIKVHRVVERPEHPTFPFSE